MKFRFALEKVLKHKHTLEDLARREWIEAQAAVDASMNQLNEMYAQVDQARQLVATREASGQARGFELGQIDEFVRGHKIRIERHRQKVRELMGKAETLHEALVAAARERKTFEKLKEKKFEEYKALRKKMDLKFMDEIATTRFKGEGEA